MLRSRHDERLFGEQLDRVAALSAGSQRQRPPSATNETTTTTTTTSKLKKQLMDFIRVNDEFVQLQAPAVLRCRIQSGALARQLPAAPPRFLVDSDDGLAGDLRALGTSSQLAIEWFTSDGFQLQAGELARGKSPRAAQETRSSD